MPLKLHGELSFLEPPDRPRLEQWITALPTRERKPLKA